MRQRFQVVLSTLAVAFAAVTVDGQELPALAVKLSTGTTLRATFDPKTNADHLWLRFGSATTVVRRSFDWRTIDSVWEGQRQLTQQQLIQIAADARRLKTIDADRNVIIVPSSDSTPPIRPMRREPTARTQVTSVTFDAMLGNWDADVATDGLWVHVLPVNADSEAVAVRGVLTVELYSLHRVDQNALPHGRGSDVRLVGQWSVPVSCEPGADGGGWVRLPFSTVHPEFDVEWAPYGLVHVQFAAAGHGVFQHSIDGMRIRPWAPLRDVLEQKTGTRFLPSEVSQ